MDRKAEGRAWKRRREDAGLDQAEAAKKAGISRVSLSRYENGEREMPTAVRESLAPVYSTPPVARETRSDGVASLTSSDADSLMLKGKKR